MTINDSLFILTLRPRQNKQANQLRCTWVYDNMKKKNNIKTLSYSDADPWHMICYSLSFAQHYADVVSFIVMWRATGDENLLLNSSVQSSPS